MCGRFTMTVSAKDVADVPALEPRYNVAPTQPVAAVRAAADGHRSLAMLRWGLIPSWARDAKADPAAFEQACQGLLELYCKAIDPTVTLADRSPRPRKRG